MVSRPTYELPDPKKAEGRYDRPKSNRSAPLRDCYFVSGASPVEGERSHLCDVLHRAFEHFPHARNLKIFLRPDQSYGVECEKASVWQALAQEPPSFMTGLAQVVDIGDTFHHWVVGVDPDGSDRLAIQNDWQVVGQDLEDAAGSFAEYESEWPKKTRPR
jgi:hypothetical protein